MDKVVQFADLYKIKDKLRFVFITTNYVFDSKIFDDNIIKQLDISTDNSYLYSYDDGSIVRWNKEIKEVIFAGIKERQYWYEKSYYQRQYSDKNANKDKIIIAYNYDESNNISSSDFITMNCENDYPLKFKYIFLHNEKTLKIIFEIEEIDKKLLNNLFVDFNFYFDPEIVNPSVRSVRVIFNDDHVYMKYLDKYIIIDENIQCINEKTIVSICIDKDGLFEQKARIPYNIYVFKKIYSEGNPIIVGIQFHDIDDKLQTANMGFVQIQ